jgi:hypothetical protein
MAASQVARRPRVALPTAIAGLLGTLAGTVVGGLISLKAVDESISAAEASEVRATRGQAYGVFASDITRHMQLLEGEFGDSNSIDAKEGAELDQSNLTISRSIAAAYLVASDTVRTVIDDLNKVESAYEKAVREGESPEDLQKAYWDGYAYFLKVARDDVVPPGG